MPNNVHPKGSMCTNCTKKLEKCNYNFSQMPVIEKYTGPDGCIRFVVKCIYFERQNG